MEAVLQRLADANINLLPTTQITTHFVFERDGFVSLVERKPEGFGRVGAPGLLTEKGFAALVWRAESAFFVGKGTEQPASTEQVELIRKFAADLEQALAEPRA
jgi:hypothetical protein